MLRCDRVRLHLTKNILVKKVLFSLFFAHIIGGTCNFDAFPCFAPFLSGLSRCDAFCYLANFKGSSAEKGVRKLPVSRLRNHKRLDPNNENKLLCTRVRDALAWQLKLREHRPNPTDL